MQNTKSLTKLPEIQSAGPKQPKHLKAAGRQLWLSVVNAFVLEPHDLILLDSLAAAIDRRDLAEKVLRDHGRLTVENRHGELKQHPAVAIVRDCNVLIARLRRELNLSEGAEESRPPQLKFGGKR
jgi:P27 family predicted phage terminase small subunit